MALEAVAPIESAGFHPGDDAATQWIVAGVVRPLRPTPKTLDDDSLDLTYRDRQAELLFDTRSRVAGEAKAGDVVLGFEINHLRTILQRRGMSSHQMQVVRRYRLC